VKTKRVTEFATEISGLRLWSPVTPR